MRWRRTPAAAAGCGEGEHQLAMIDNPKPVAYQAVECPHCGLAVQVSQDPKAPDLRYDREAWLRRCRHQGPNSPASCLAADGALKSALQKRPLYQQLHDEMVGRIARGDWKPGAAIPNESELAREFGVSAGTMRKALDLMESERLITRRQGRGTFLADQSEGELAHRFMNVFGPAGKRLIGEVASVEIAEGTVNETECRRLGLHAGDRVYRIRRVRCIGGRPFMVEDAAMPAALFPGLEGQSAAAETVVSIATKYGILLGKGEERITIAAAPADIDDRPVERRLAWCQLDGNYYCATLT
jgi:GntR family transcriptional regulator